MNYRSKWVQNFSIKALKKATKAIATLTLFLYLLFTMTLVRCEIVKIVSFYQDKQRKQPGMTIMLDHEWQQVCPATTPHAEQEKYLSQM